MSRSLFSAVALSSLLCLMPACGGGSSSSTTGGGGGTSGGGGGTGAVNPPVVVTVAAGQKVTGINVSVATPTGTAPNAEDLGVAASLSGASAANTGASIAQGTTMSVLLFGPGLGGSMQVSVLGPPDITLSNVQGITASDGTPGVAFTATVAGNAALGGRTVVLEDSNNNVTTFTGGLEVVQ